MNNLPSEVLAMAERQEYIDVAYPWPAEVHGRFVPEFYQPKYDGIWAKVIWNGESPSALIYSRTGQLKGHLPVPSVMRRFGAFILIGEYLVSQQRAVGSPDYGKLRLFDCLYLRDLPHLPFADYKERYGALRDLAASQVNAITPWLLTPCWHLSTLPELWAKQVSTGVLEGVVYRRWEQKYKTALHRSKLRVETDAFICGFVRGQGKYLNTLGALELRYFDDPVTFTCSGMDDADRDKFWNNQEFFLMKVVTVEGRGFFDSGKPRHPQFLRVHADKPITACLKPTISKSATQPLASTTSSS